MTDRREFLKTACRGAALLGIGAVAGSLLLRHQAASESTAWQIDPQKCIGCTGCYEHCVLTVSAVKCFHNHAMCGYCELCTGFFDTDPIALSAGAENQLCPTGAIRRLFVEEPYFEYVIDKELCIGCGKCVKGCTRFGNGSLYLQIDHRRCEQCNQCAIAIHCPAQAIARMPATVPYQLKEI